MWHSTLYTLCVSAVGRLLKTGDELARKRTSLMTFFAKHVAASANKVSLRILGGLDNTAACDIARERVNRTCDSTVIRNEYQTS
jgi:hypothetical protein